MSGASTRRAAAVLLLAAAAPACFGGGREAGPGELRVAAVSGGARARSGAAAPWRPLRRGDVVRAGHQLETSTSGRLRLLARDGEEIELGGGTALTVRAPLHLAVAAGAVLVVGKETPVTVESGDVSARAENAAFRFDRALSLRVGVYRGDSRVGVGGSALNVPRLREVVVGGGVLPREPGPLLYDPQAPDAWDRRFLAEALDLDRDLRSLGRGFHAQFGRRAPGAEFFLPFLPLPDPGFVGEWIDRAESFDLLTGLVYAAAASRATGRPLASLFAEMLDLRMRGAGWGLIAEERGLDPAEVLRLLVAAIDLGTRPASTTGGGGGPGGGGPGPTPSPSPTGGGSPSPSPSPTRSPTPSPSPTPTCGPIDFIIDPDRCSPDAGSPPLSPSL